MSRLLLTKSSEPFFSVIQVWLSLLTMTLYEVTQSLLLILENQGGERKKRNILSGLQMQMKHWGDCEAVAQHTSRHAQFSQGESPFKNRKIGEEVKDFILEVSLEAFIT